MANRDVIPTFMAYLKVLVLLRIRLQLLLEEVNLVKNDHIL
jgi:hypothetical protein